MNEHKRWVLPVLSAALVGAVVIGLYVGGTFGGGEQHEARLGATLHNRQGVTWHAYQGVHLPVPEGWKAFPVTFGTAALDYPIGYITDQPTGPECSAAGCGAPLQDPTVRSGGILISIATGTIFIDPAHRPWVNTAVAGLPARRTENTCHGECGPDGTQHASIVIKLDEGGGDTPATGLILNITIGPHGDQTRRQLNTMLAHAKYR